VPPGDELRPGFLEIAVLLRLTDVAVWLEDGASILNGISWSIGPGEHWAVIGPNGAGKSTLLSVATARRYPSRGRVEVLGRTFGEGNMLELRQLIGIVDPHLRLYDWFTAEEIVLTGIDGTVQPRPDGYSGDEVAHARQMMSRLGLAGMEEREIKTCSQGERQRVRIARALMTRPRLLFLDEPASGLDLPAREALIGALGDLSWSDPELATVVISHHLEELAPTTSHAMLMRSGGIVAAGPVDEVLTGRLVSETFAIPISIARSDGRWTARGSGSWHGR
jgi:iron complex transport system ATP-binding protein